MYDTERKEYMCDECGMIADPMVLDHERELCEGCAPNDETPEEWLRSHLPASKDDERTMSRHDLRCIQLALAGLTERDTWMPVITELHNLLWPDDDVERDPARDIAATVRDLIDERDKLAAQSKHYKNGLTSAAYMIYNRMPDVRDGAEILARMQRTLLG